MREMKERRERKEEGKKRRKEGKKGIGKERKFYWEGIDLTGKKIAVSPWQPTSVTCMPLLISIKDFLICITLFKKKVLKQQITLAPECCSEELGDWLFKNDGLQVYK